MTVRPEVSDGQFRLRTLLASVGFIAVCCAVIAPTFRAWSWAERKTFLSVCSGGLLAFVATALVLVLPRMSHRRRAGATLVSLRLPRARFIAVSAGLAAAACVAGLIYSAALEVRMAASSQSLSLAGAPLVAGMWLGSHAAIFGTMFTKMAARIDLCEHGLLTAGGVFAPWSSLVAWHWDGSAAQHLVIHMRWSRTCVLVPDMLRDEVELVLRRHYSPEPGLAGAGAALTR